MGLFTVNVKTNVLSNTKESQGAKRGIAVMKNIVYHRILNGSNILFCSLVYKFDLFNLFSGIYVYI